MVVGNSTPKWDDLVIGATQTFLRSNSTDPAWSANVDPAGYFAESSTSPASLTCGGAACSVNDVDPGTTGYLRQAVTTGKTVTITGFSGGAAGRFLLVRSLGPGILAFAPENGGSAAANRFTFPAVLAVVSAVTLGTDDLIQFNYDSSSSRWVMSAQYQVAGALSATLGPTFGGTGLTTYVTGDTLYASAANTLSRLPAGTAWKGYRMNSAGTLPEWGGLYQQTLAADITCAVSASYCTIWSITPPVVSAGVTIKALLHVVSASTTVAPQFRVSSADSGYTGKCTWTIYDRATTATTAPLYLTTSIGTAPPDTAATAWIEASAPTPVEVICTLLADASPGAILIEWQLETGTSPTQTVRKGSRLTWSQN
jgi:hypothetical protein